VGSDSEGSGSDDLGSDNSEGSSNDNDDGEDNGSNDGEDKAMHIPFRMTPARIMWFKCPVCLGEEYDSKAKVVPHVVEVIKQDVGSLDVVERHRQVLWATQRRC
jgi:hypothetical protein